MGSDHGRIEMQYWDPMDLAPGQGRRIQVGPLHIWVRRTEHEWRLAWAGNEPLAERWDGIAGEDPPDHAEWHRWAAAAGQNRLHLSPVLPDRPLVIRPQAPLYIPPGVKLRIYVRVPIWLRVTAGDAKLTEIPSVHLSNTWFGAPDAGELAWALKTDALHAPEDVPAKDHEALCRVDVNHKGSDQLELNRLFLRAAHLRVYQAGERLWTNGVKAVYEGGEKVGSVDYLKSAPSQAVGAVKLSDEREPASGAMVRTRAGLLRSLELDKLWIGGGAA